MKRSPACSFIRRAHLRRPVVSVMRPWTCAGLASALAAALALGGCALPAREGSSPGSDTGSAPAGSAPIEAAEPAYVYTAQDLTAGIETEESTYDVKAIDAHAQDAADFSLRLFQAELDHVGKGDTNTLVSPLSVSRALALLANGAENSTLTQLEEALGMSRDELNAFLPAYERALSLEPNALTGADDTWIDSPLAAERPQKDKGGDASEDGTDETDDESTQAGSMSAQGKELPFTLAESLWINSAYLDEISPSFLKTNASVYNAQVFSAPFDATTTKDINAWVSDKTDGMIPELLAKDTSAKTRMYLVSALAFDANWQTPYEEEDVDEDATFTSASGDEQPMRLMRSTEHVYLEDDGATGFVKSYEDGLFSFVALLPEEGTSVRDYAASLTGERVSKLLENATYCDVKAGLPSFTLDYTAHAKEALQDLGVTDAFDAKAADLTGIAEKGGLFVSDVTHKTHITVDEKGTEAAAATGIGVSEASANAEEEEPKEVVLDRPFVYLIVDNQNNLPIFIGTMETMEGQVAEK